MSMELWVNDTDRNNKITRKDNCPSGTLSTTNLTLTGLEANQGLRGEIKTN